VYLSGQQQQGPVDISAPKATLTSNSSSGKPAGSKAKRQKQGSEAPAASSQQPAQVNTSALQNLIGGETVFYGECARQGASPLALAATQRSVK
jgi:hypothetical protein